MDLSVVVHEQLSEASAYTPLLHLVIAALFLVLLGYSIRRFPISLPSTNNTDHLYFSELPLSAVLVNRQGKICSVNLAAAQSVKRTPASLVNQSVHELFHPQKTPHEKCLLCQHISAGLALMPTDFAITKHNWQQISLSNVTTENGIQLLQLHVDITNRKQIEERISLVIDGAKLGYWDWDYATGKHQVNQHWLNMLGLKPKELDHYVSDWEHRIHPDDRDRVRNTIANHIDSNTPYVIEFRMRHKAGHWVWIQGSGAVVEHDPVSGQPVRICGTHQDITARKHFENNLQVTYQIISQSSSVVLKWNCAEGLPIEFATENVLHLLGYTVEELSTGNIFYLSLIHPEDQANFTEEISLLFIENKFLSLGLYKITDAALVLNDLHGLQLIIRPHDRVRVHPYLGSHFTHRRDLLFRRVGTAHYFLGYAVGNLEKDAFVVIPEFHIRPPFPLI